MSLTQSVFSDTLRRFDSNEFFFFSVRLFVLFGVNSSELVSVGKLGTVAAVVGAVGEEDATSGGGVGFAGGTTAAGREAGIGGTAVRSAGFGGVIVPGAIGASGCVRFCFKSITFASFDLFGLSSRLSRVLLSEETNPGAVSGKCKIVTTFGIEGKGPGVKGGFSAAGAAFVSSVRLGRGGGTGGALSRCSLRGSMAGGISDSSSSYAGVL